MSFPPFIETQTRQKFNILFNQIKTSYKLDNEKTMIVVIDLVKNGLNKKIIENQNLSLIE